MSWPKATASSIPGGDNSSNDANDCKSTPAVAKAFMIPAPTPPALLLSSSRRCSTFRARRKSSTTLVGSISKACREPPGDTSSPSSLMGTGSPVRLHPRASPSEWAGSVDTTSVLWPDAAQRTAKEAAVVVFPTPPLPPTKRKRRSPSASRIVWSPGAFSEAEEKEAVGAVGAVRAVEDEALSPDNEWAPTLVHRARRPEIAQYPQDLQGLHAGRHARSTAPGIPGLWPGSRLARCVNTFAHPCPVKMPRRSADSSPR
mmetsp:Transcript_63444/g.138154  ORF Transcript_63444/g.138154 Transcript_63444/m.138154 type:complete len:258 (+) Transcript_63444:723-1496(+)